MPLVFFHTPWKYQKTGGFTIFSWGIERDWCSHRIETSQSIFKANQLTVLYMIVTLLVNGSTLTHCGPMLYFYTPYKRQKTRFQMIEKWTIGLKWDKPLLSASNMLYFVLLDSSLFNFKSLLSFYSNQSIDFHREWTTWFLQDWKTSFTMA